MCDILNIISPTTIQMLYSNNTIIIMTLNQHILKNIIIIRSFIKTLCHSSPFQSRTNFRVNGHVATGRFINPRWFLFPPTDHPSGLTGFMYADLSAPDSPDLRNSDPRFIAGTKQFSMTQRRNYFMRNYFAQDPHKYISMLFRR